MPAMGRQTIQHRPAAFLFAWLTRAPA